MGESDKWPFALRICILNTITKIVYFLLSWPSTMLNMSGYVHQNLKRNATTIILNIIISFVFIFSLGINGAAVSTVLNSLVAIQISYFFIKKHLKLDIVKIIKE